MSVLTLLISAFLISALAGIIRFCLFAYDRFLVRPVFTRENLPSLITVGGVLLLGAILAYVFQPEEMTDLLLFLMHLITGFLYGIIVGGICLLMCWSITRRPERVYS